MSEVNYIRVEEFKEWNPEIDFSSYTDITLSGMISRASRWVDDYLGYSPIAEDVEGEVTDALVNTDNDLLIFPKKIPLIRLDRVVILLGNTETEINLIDSNGNEIYNIPEPRNYALIPFLYLQLLGKAMFRVPSILRQRQFFVKIDYRGGYEELPLSIKDATNLVAKDIFMRQSNPMYLTSVSQGGISMSFQAGETYLLQRAKELLEPYVRRY